LATVAKIVKRVHSNNKIIVYGSAITDLIEDTNSIGQNNARMFRPDIKYDYSLKSLSQLHDIFKLSILFIEITVIFHPF
jgi:hypothetical protein